MTTQRQTRQHIILQHGVEIHTMTMTMVGNQAAVAAVRMHGDHRSNVFPKLIRCVIHVHIILCVYLLPTYISELCRLIIIVRVHFQFYATLSHAFSI